MHRSASRYHHTYTPAAIAAGLLLAVCPLTMAQADGAPDFYVGGALGQSHLDATVSEVSADVFPETYTESIDRRHTAFQVMLGARPVSLVGAEIEYVDLGEPSGTLFGNPADISMKGEAAFGVLYLPVPIVDVYLKAGVARLQSTVNGSICSPCACDVCRDFFQVDRTNTSGAGGIGVQYRLGSWAVRAEYERFNAAGGNPSLVSAGVTWNFF